MKRVVLFVVCTCIGMGQLGAQISREVYRERLDRLGIKFNQPKGSAELEISEVKAMIKGMPFPLVFDGYGLAAKKIRVIYGSALTYALGDNKTPDNAVRADRIRYLIGYNIALSSSDLSRKLDIEYLIGHKDYAIPFIENEDQIKLIGQEEARKRFNADSILVYSIPLKTSENFKYCTSLVVFKKSVALSILLFLPEQEMKHQNKYLKKLDGTIWFPEKIISPPNDSLIYGQTALSKRISANLNHPKRNNVLTNRILEEIKQNETRE